MKCVKITVAFQNYRVDDIAAFEDKVADKVIDAGYGEEVDAESTKIEKKK